MAVFNVELKKIVDDSYEIEIGYDLMDKLVEDLKSVCVQILNYTIRYYGIFSYLTYKP